MATTSGKSRGNRQPSRPEGGQEDRPEAGNGGAATGGEVPAPGTTGRYLVLMRQDGVEAGVNALNSVAGVKVARTADFAEGNVDSETLATADAVLFSELGVAVVTTPPEQLNRLRVSADESGILAIEPERINYAIDEMTGNSGAGMSNQQPASASPKLAVEYLMGYREAVNHLVDRMLAEAGVSAATGLEAEIQAAITDETELTWGLQITRVPESRFTGKGIRLAVLDTGFDLEHPDFLGRRVVSRSFIDGEAVQDGHGHGTHCIGTAMGPKQPGSKPRYGIAYEADIYAGKVLSNAGSGADAGILAGIGWAIRNNCQIVSMSLGAAVQIGEGYSMIYETVARRALAAGTLIIAAAGNESQRPGFIAPVGRPANSPSILAVGALDSALLTARFSCGGLEGSGGQVDIAGPGVAVRSSWPRPTMYRTISGTSMATPHVAGIAALHAQANPGIQGGALGWLLLQSARRVDLSAADVGAGLVQAP